LEVKEDLLYFYLETYADLIFLVLAWTFVVGLWKQIEQTRLVDWILH